MTNVLVFGGEAFATWLGRALVNGICALIRRDPRDMITLSPPNQTQPEDGHLQTRERVLTSPGLCWHPGLRIPCFQNWEINFYCVSHPVYDILLQ